MKHNKLLQYFIVILLCSAFAALSAVMFIFGKRFYDSDWLLSIYCIVAFLFLWGLFMVLFPKTTFKMIYNKYTVKYMEESENGYVAPEYMARHFFMKLRWGLMGIGIAAVCLLALLCVFL